jgi:hypothetical protein
MVIISKNYSSFRYYTILYCMIFFYFFLEKIDCDKFYAKI